MRSQTEETDSRPTLGSRERLAQTVTGREGAGDGDFKKTLPALTMEALALLYRRYRQRIWLKRFMRVVDPPYWRLRDCLRAGKVREQRLHARSRAAATVEAVAATETTYGYRCLYPRLRRQGMRIGRE